ncbi:MAG TPA: ribonuclease Z [Saprospiraceae bacterium]|nr:ribonuclease Z [Saprospiraceae bacterium]
MSNFSVTILGTNSSVPANNRALSSQVVYINNNLYIIDCGEGTQNQLSKYKIKRNKVRAVFISHCHGDHLYGLPGLLSSYTHFEREEKLYIFGPIGIKLYLDTIFKISHVHLTYPIEIVECDTETHGMIYEDDSCCVYNFSLVHRIPSQGFIFTEKIDPFRIDPLKIKLFNLTVNQIKTIKKGQSIIINGEKLDHKILCHPPHIPKKYVYASDTSPLSIYPDLILNTNTLYHEATYLHDLKNLAIERGHSTAFHAAKFAQKIHAKKLLLGHFSSRYKDSSLIEKEAIEIFENSIACMDGVNYIV